MKPSSSPSERLQLLLNIPFRRAYSRDDEKGVIKNISLTGAYLESSINDSLKVSDKIKIELSLENRTRKISCQIIWKRPSGCGLKFLPSNGRDVQIIDDLIYYAQNNRENKRDVINLILNQAA